VKLRYQNQQVYDALSKSLVSNLSKFEDNEIIWLKICIDRLASVGYKNKDLYYKVGTYTASRKHAMSEIAHIEDLPAWKKEWAAT